MRLTRWDRFLSLFGIKTTWRWCVIGCTFGRHSWSYSLEKCRNGMPVIAGGWLTVYGCHDEAGAKNMCSAMNEAAAEINAKNGYAS